MDSSVQSPPPEVKATFRKPSNDAAHRKYRRHSPASGSSEDGSPKRERNSSPTFPKRDPAKASEHQQRRKDDEKELDRDSGRSRFGKSGDSYRHSDRHSSRNSHGYSRHDDYSRHEKRADEGRHYQSSHSGWESRDVTHSDHTREESERSRSRDYVRNVDKYSRDRYDSSGHRSKDKEKESLSSERLKLRDKDLSPDRIGSSRKHTNSTSEEKDRDRHRRDRDGRDEKRDYHKSSGDHKSDRTLSYEETRGYRNDPSGRDDGHRVRESYKNDQQELSGQKERKKHDNWETNRDKDRYSRAQVEQIEDKSFLGSENQESPAKKPKLFSSDTVTDHNKDDEKQSSSSKLTQEIDDKVTVGEVHANNTEAANDLNAAKVAAMKAAELVNKNLVGVGFMSTEQKKKLLWGNKKSTATEESGHRWDAALFDDRERQEKFNKLMGVKGDVKVEHRPNNQDGSGRLQAQAEKQKELQMDLEKQYTAGLRRRDGRTVGLGL